MSHWFDEPRARQDVVTVPLLWVTIALSILIHVAVLFLWIPRTHLFAPGELEQDQAGDRLQVRLAAQQTPTSPLPESLPQMQASPQTAPKPPRTVLRMRPPPVVTQPVPEVPAILALPPAAPPVAAPPRTIPPPEGDLAAYIQARRRERGEREAPPIDNETAQFDRTIAANLPAPARGVAAQDTKRGGGIFGIKRMTYDDAAFEFYGWNTSMGRKTPQLIEVRKGDNSDMRIAVVRRMIVIIREFEKEDFNWESPRWGRTVVLSARLSDNAALENFLMREFFDDARAQ